MSDRIGSSMGPYQVIEQLGMGGMATVYKAYQPAMERYVALKVLPQHMARDPGFRERFSREARTIARLEHRYILPVYDVGEADGIPFLVMRYTTGGTLSDLIAAGPIPFARSVRLVAQVGEALEYAHAEGVIHRDIKPANVLLDRDGTPLLTDFGIAKIVAGTMQLTAEGALIGTPFYMAPEQAQGRAADARTDIYALGVVLYELVTGRRPYIAETPLAVALMHVHEPLPLPRQLNPAIPEALERVILKALAKRAEDRFQTAAAMVAALRAVEPQLDPALTPAPAVPTVILPESTPATAALPATAAPALPAPPAVPAPPTPVRPTRRWLLPLLGALAALALVALIVAPRLTPQPTDTPQPTASLPASNAAAGPTLTPRTTLSVFADTSEVYAQVALGDTVWLATDGGLVRYDASGTPRAFSAADGLPFNWTPAFTAAPDGTLWAGAYEQVAHIRPVAGGLGEVTSYDAQDGLDIGDIYALIVDPIDGAVWAGGYSGLRRFDGSRWVQPALAPDDAAVAQLTGAVVSLLRASDGALWVGRSGEGLLRWDGARWTHYADAQGVGAASRYRLLQANDGTLWATADEHGLLRFAADEGRWEQAVAPPEGGYIDNVGQIGDGRLWLTTSAGLQQSDASGTRWTTVDVPDGYLGTGGVVQTQDTRLWVGGASIFADGAWTKLKPASAMPFSSATRIVQAPDGNLWALQLYGGPVAVIDPQSLAVERYPLDARIYSVAFSTDTAWFGTSAGIIRQRNGAQASVTAADGLPSDDIRQLLATDSVLWIGTDTGLATYDLSNEQITSVPEFEGGIVDVLFQAPDGAIWAGSHRENELGFGLLGRFDGSSWQLWQAGELPNPEDRVEVTGLSADSAGQVWLTTWSSGLYRWDGARWETWTAEDGAPQATLLALGARGDEMLIGGALGGSLFRWTSDGWSTLPVDGLSGQVDDILVTADGALWLATSDGLLRQAPE